MIRRFAPVLLLLLCATLTPAQDPSPLEKLDPAKLAPAVKPTKGMPPEVLARLGLKGDKVDCYAFRPDGKYLAISGPDQYVRIWGTDGLKFVYAAKQPDSVVCMTFSPDSKLLAVGDAGGKVRVWDKVESKFPVLKALLDAHKDGPVGTLAFDPDGKRLVTSGRDKSLKFWDLSAKPRPTLITSKTEFADDVWSTNFSADGKTLYTMSPDEKQVRVWDVSGDRPKAGENIKLPGKALTVSVAPDGSSVAVAGEKTVSAILPLKDGKAGEPIDLETEKRPALSAYFSPDGSMLVGTVYQSETQRRLLVWGKDGKKLHEFNFESRIHATGFAPDSRHVVVITETATLILRIPK